MTMATAEAPAELAPGDLGQLSDAELADAYESAIVADRDTAPYLAECERRDRAARAAARSRARSEAARDAWHVAAHAAMLAASADCRGQLFKPWARDRADGPRSELDLWTGTEAWARKWASEELCAWWDVNGRLTVTEYRRQQAGERAAWLDERDREASAVPLAPVWVAVPGGEVSETRVTVDGEPRAAWWARDAGGDVTLHRSRDLATAALAPRVAPVAAQPAPASPRPPVRRTDTAGAYAAALAGAARVVTLTAGRAAVLAQIGRDHR